jgi:hypothetical protein
MGDHHSQNLLVGAAKEQSVKRSIHPGHGFSIAMIAVFPQAKLLFASITGAAWVTNKLHPQK